MSVLRCSSVLNQENSSLLTAAAKIKIPISQRTKIDGIENYYTAGLFH